MKPVLLITCNMNKLTHITYMAMYLITLIKTNSDLSIFARLPIYAPKLHPDATTFEINGHEPLYNTTMMNVTYCEQIVPYN